MGAVVGVGPPGLVMTAVASHGTVTAHNTPPPPGIPHPLRAMGGWQRIGRGLLLRGRVAVLLCFSRSRSRHLALVLLGA